jgi:hypothetical protein
MASTNPAPGLPAFCSEARRRIPWDHGQQRDRSGDVPILPFAGGLIPTGPGFRFVLNSIPFKA